MEKNVGKEMIARFVVVVVVVGRSFVVQFW